MVRTAPPSSQSGWLLLAAVAFLIALVIGLAGAVAALEPPVSSPRLRADRGAEPARIAPIGNGSAANPVVVEAPVPILRERAVSDTVAARVRFRLGMPSTHYTGVVQLFTDEIAQPLLQVANCDPVDFVVPRVARRLRSEAPGCSPVDLELPPLGPGLLDLGEITFWPDSSVTFVVVGLPAEYDGAPSFAAASSDYELRVGEIRNWRPGSTTQLGFPCGGEISWQAEFRGQHALGLVSGREPGLRAGEHRTIVVDASALRPVLCQVIGPSTELLPHLVVQVQPADRGAIPLPSMSVTLDDNGKFTVAGVAGGAFSLVVHSGDGVLHETRRGENLELRPRSPLVGLVFRDARGTLLPFACNQQPTAAVFVAEREQLRSLCVSGKGLPLRRIRPADLPLDHDLVDLARVPAMGLGELVVHLAGEPLEPMRRAVVQVLRTDGTLVTSSLARTRTELGAVEPGDVDLRWCVDGTPGGWLARRVSVAAGELRELRAEWPQSMVWTGEVAGQADAEAGRRFHSVRFGHAPGLFGGHWVKVGPEGSFRLSLPPGAGLAEDVDLRCVMMTVRADVVSIDQERRHVVLRPPAGLRWVDLVVAPEVVGPWAASLTREGRDEPWMMEWSREQRPILVPPGVRLGGALWSTAGAGELLAWFEVDGSQPQVTVGRATGRSVEFRNGGAIGRLFALVGPRGQLFDCGTLTSEPMRRFVPDGTRGFLVVDPDHLHGERRELPIPPGDFVIVP